MPTKLRVLILEDNAADAELELHELRRAGYDLEWKRVETEQEYLAQIDQGWEVILADCKLPEFNALRALELLRERDSGLPFIIVSGTIGEDKAVAAIKAGANDYIIKDRLARLGPAVERALRDAAEWRERKRAEVVLRERESKLETLFELLPIGVSILDAERKIIFMNSALERILEISKETLLRGDYENRTYLRPDRTPMPAEEYASVRAIAEQRAVHNVETGVVKEDGTIVWTSVSAVPVNYPDWKVVIVTDDITERKRAEEALRTSEAQLSNALQMARAGHWEYDVDRDTFTFNDNFYRIFRTTAAEMGGYQMSSADYARRFCYPEDAAVVGDETRAAIESSDPNHNRQIEHRILYADGEVGIITVRFFVIKDAHGRTVKTYGVNQDITERKRAEEALRQAEENFRRSMDESPVGICIVSDKGETLYANRAILDIYGYKDIEELNATPVKRRYTPESYFEFQLRKKKRTNKENYSSEYEISIIRKTGEIRHLQVFRKEVLWNGQIESQAIYRDISEHKKDEEKLRETLSNLSNALGGIIQVLSAATEKRDPYTAGHQKRVADLARAIGQEMGLAKERVEGLRLTGIIHDIGKISIPAEILSKPGSLTENEYKLIQEHPKIGHDILGGIKLSWPAGKTILQHHERMNGSGYPAGLKGDDILLEARILAVSDVVEAMASHRPYRSALGIEAALEEIDKNKGVLYDSDVAAACLKLFREKGFIFGVEVIHGLLQSQA